MSTINKIILVAVSIMLLAASAVIGFTNLQTSKDNTAMPEKSNTTLHGGYDAYDDTYISGTQVETALTIYGSVDRGGHGKVSGDLADGEEYIPYTDSGYCYVQNGGSLARSEGKNADDWIKDPNYADHLVNYTGDGGITQDDFKDYHNQKKEASYLNPEGLFHATLVLGEDMADEDLRLNYPNKVMYIKFTQVKQHNNVPPPDPSAPTEEPVPVEPSGTPDELNFIICDKPVIWEGTYKTDLLKDIVKAQGIKVEFYETSGPEVSTTIIPDADWNFIDTSVTFRATDLSNKQKVKVSYKGLTGTMEFTVVQLLSVNGMVTDSYKPKLYPGASHSVDVNHFRTSRAGSGIENVKYNPGIPVMLGEITDDSGSPITNNVFYNKQTFKSAVSGASFSDNLEMTVGKDVDGYKATRKLDIQLIWSDVRIGYFNHTAAYTYYVAKYGTDESNVDTYWNELKTYCSYLEDVEDTFREGEEHANKRAWILGVGDDSGWTKRSRGSAHYEIIGATDPKGPITSQIAEGDVVTFYSNVAGMTLASNGDTGLQTVTTFAEGGAQVPQSSVISSFLTYRAVEHKTAIIGFNFPDSGNKSVVNYFNDNGSVRGLSVKQALCPMVGKQTLRNSSYNFVTKAGISQEYNDSDDATTAWTTKSGKGDNRWCVDYVTNGRTPLTISNENSVAWEFPAATEDRTFSSEKGTKMTVTEDSKCIEMGSRASDSDSLNVSLKAELKMEKDGNSFKSGSQGFRLLQASFKDFGGRYTGIYTIYNWYPSVVVKANCGVEKEGETGHVAQPGEPYIVNVSQADADVTVNCSDPLMQDVMWEDASNDAFGFGSWSTGSPITWAKNATVTTEMKTDEDGNRVTKYPNAANVSLAIKATRKRVSDVSAASVEFKERSTKLYTYRWYIGGDSHSEPLSSNNECDKGTKADTSTGECKDKNRIAVSDYIMNAQNIVDSSINEMTIKLYESGSNNTNAPAKEPTGKPLATLGNGTTDNDYMKFNGKTLYLKRGKLTERQVYTLVVQGKQGSDKVNGETFNWGPNPVYYYVYNLYNSKFNNQIASATDDCDVSVSNGVYSVVLDKDSEIYVKSFYSAIYKTGNFSPSDAFTFKKGTSKTNDYSRTIVNAKDNGTRNSNGKNADRDTEADYFHVYAKAAAATYNGEDAKIKVVHPEFANRTKATKMKLYKKLDKTVNIVERHSTTIDLGLPDGCQISNNDAAEFDDDNIVLLQGSAYTHIIDNKTSGKYLDLSFNIRNESEEQTNNKYVRRARIKSDNSLEIIARTYKSGTGPAKIYVYNKKGVRLGAVTVKTLPFKVSILAGMIDNIGYGKDTLDKKIFLEIEDVYAGDDLYVFTNVKGSTVSVKAEGAAAENLDIKNRDLTTKFTIKKDKVFRIDDNDDGNFETTLKLSDNDNEFEYRKVTLNAKGLGTEKYWDFYTKLCDTKLKATATDTNIAQLYKSAGVDGNTGKFTINLKATQVFAIINNVWQYNWSKENKFWNDKGKKNPFIAGTVYGWKRTGGWYDKNTANPMIQDLQYYNLLGSSWNWAMGGLGPSFGYATNNGTDIPLQSFIRLYTRDSNSDGIGVNACVKAKHEFAGSIGGEYYSATGSTREHIQNGGWTHYYEYSMVGTNNNPFIFSKVTEPPSGWKNTYTSMHILNSGGMSMQANKYGSTEATNADETSTSPYMSISPFVNSETEDRYKFLDNLSWSGMGKGAKSGIVTDKGAVRADYFTDKRYCVMLNAGKPGNSDIYINNQALAQFTTKNDKQGHKYIYFNTPAHSIIVTYKIDDGNWKIIKQGTSDPKEQISDLYDKDKTRLRAAAKYDEDGKITGGVNFDPNKNMFGFKNYLSFRKDTHEVGVGPTKVIGEGEGKSISYSGSSMKDSVLVYGTMNKLLGVDLIANGNGYNVNKDYSNPPNSLTYTTRIDATALEWTKCTNYVDVNFTYVTNPEAGSRQVTFPVRLIMGKQ